MPATARKSNRKGGGRLGKEDGRQNEMKHYLSNCTFLRASVKPEPAGAAYWPFLPLPGFFPGSRLASLPAQAAIRVTAVMPIMAGCTYYIVEESNMPTFDLDFAADRDNAHAPQIRLWYQTILTPGDVIELRVLHTTTGTVSGYFDFDHIDELVEASVQYSGQAPAVYTTINPAQPDLLARAFNHTCPWAKNTTADCDIVKRNWLPLDFDPARPAGISSTGEEYVAAMSRAYAAAIWLQELGFPEAGIIYANSGNGAHLPVQIDLPNDEPSKLLVKTCIEAVAGRFPTIKSTSMARHTTRHESGKSTARVPPRAIPPRNVRIAWHFFVKCGLSRTRCSRQGRLNQHDVSHRVAARQGSKNQGQIHFYTTE